MERLTYFDYFANCYKMRPNAPQGQIIQTLGKYEDAAGEVTKAELVKVLEKIKGEKLLTSLKDDPTEWRRGYDEGLKVAAELIKGALE